jgi:FkbM family methyltransferase
MINGEAFKLYLSTVGVKGILAAARAKLQNRQGIFKVRRTGLRHPIYVRLPSSDILAFREVLLNEEYKTPVMSSPKVIVDAGANIGLTSVYFANIFPEARIFALEPEEENFQLLKKNVAPYAGIVPLSVALWDEAVDIQVVDPGLGSWGFQTKKVDPFSGSMESRKSVVKAITIQQLMNNFDIQQIDILKIDIEGAEREVFRDTCEWISRVNLLIVELHERLKPGCLRSFYNGSNGFDTEWQQGENIWLMRNSP